MPPSSLTDRLQKLLLVVPYVVRHPGTRLEDLSRLFGVSRETLADDLNLLFVAGLPPYGPGDLIDVDIEDGRVWIRMAEYFSRPVRLTREEALALYLRGMALLASPGVAETEALGTALAKLRAQLGEELGALEVHAGEEVAPEGPLDEVRRAVAGRERLEIDYYSAGRDEVTTRRIDPEHVFSAIGNWYVVAWCHLVDGERLFRLDRARAVRRTDERFDPRGLLGPGRPLYDPAAEDVRVRLRLAPTARWVAEYYRIEGQRERSGGLEVTLPTKDLAWMAKLLLRLGGEAEILAPEELRDLTRRAVEDTLRHYS